METTQSENKFEQLLLFSEKTMSEMVISKEEECSNEEFLETLKLTKDKENYK